MLHCAAHAMPDIHSRFCRISAGLYKNVPPTPPRGIHSLYFRPSGYPESRESFVPSHSRPLSRNRAVGAPMPWNRHPRRIRFTPRATGIYLVRLRALCRDREHFGCFPVSKTIERAGHAAASRCSVSRALGCGIGSRWFSHAPERGAQMALRRCTRHGSARRLPLEICVWVGGF